MQRTTATAIRQVMQTGLTDAQLGAYIMDASLWVDEELQSATTGGGSGSASIPIGMSPARLEIIERYLACGLVRLQELGITDASFGDVHERYQSDPIFTDYLMRAASFDKSGKVRQAFLAPKPTSTQTPAITRFNKGYIADSPLGPYSW